MQLRFLLFFAVCSLPNSWALAHQAQDILDRSDYFRHPQTSYVVDVQLKQYENGRLTDENTVTTLSRKVDSGQFLTIVHINQPAKDRGKLMLRNDSVLWFFDPKSKSAVRISPRQRLLGNASNGDVITSNFTLDYQAQFMAEEEVVDGDKQRRPAWKLKLTASNQFAAYKSIELWIDRDNHRPLKGMFYSNSEHLLKVAWYRGWQSVLGAVRPTEIVLVDGFNPKKVTVMSMSHYRQATLPQSWFNKEWLAQFNIERDVPR